MPMSAPVPETVTTTRGRGAGVRGIARVGPLSFGPAAHWFWKLPFPSRACPAALRYAWITSTRLDRKFDSSLLEPYDQKRYWKGSFQAQDILILGKSLVYYSRSGGCRDC